MGSKAGFPGAKLLRRKLAIGFITAMVMVAGVFVYFQTRVGATTYQWLQAAWTGGADTVNFPRHGVNQTGWDKFYSKDTTQVKTSSGDIEINSTSSNWPDNFSGGTPDSNTYVSGGLVNLKKNNGVTCSADQQCTAGNCDGDFDSASSFCHATATSCPNDASEYVTDYELCSGNSYYKSCASSAWSAQQNCDTNNAYCDAGGGAQSGWRTGQTCSSGLSGGCQTPSCTSCSPYIAASTSSCKTSCTVNGDCWSGYNCCGGTCVAPSFTFNGLTYGVVLANSQCWLDRNLGATAVATAYNSPTTSYGWYFQWGRLADGHQVSTSGTTATLSTTDVPGHGNFITNGSSSPYDWRSPQNNNLWQGAGGTNNPCPSGWHVPTQPEWAAVISALGITNYTTAASSILHLPAAGDRDFNTGVMGGVGTVGFYWSSSITATTAFNLYVTASAVTSQNFNLRSWGFSVRCVKD